MKRLGDFLNVESFDLALLEEVGCLEGTALEAWLGGGAAGDRGAGHLPSGGRATPASSPFPQVWSEQDFQYLRQKLLPTYPAAHYFRR